MKENQFRVIVTSREDLSLERWTFENRADFLKKFLALRQSWNKWKGEWNPYGSQEARILYQSGTELAEI